MGLDVLLFIDGLWAAAQGGETLPITDPATDQVIGSVAHARQVDLDAALAAVEHGFAKWRKVSALERGRTLSRAAALLREREELIAGLMTQEQGKPLFEARQEVERAAEAADWLAGETQRNYGRTIPARAPNVTQYVVKDPIGPVAAFTPWNFPVNQIVRKVAGALAAGCSLVVKGPEEAPASCAELVRAFADAGVTPGALNLVYGTPSEISEHLIRHPTIRKVSFTGSTGVGKRLAALAGAHMKVATMELGGHAPVLVFDDADIPGAARALCANKFRNAGQSCINPTRLLVQRDSYHAFIEAFVDAACAIKVGRGDDPATVMGPMANPRRLQAMHDLLADALQKGAQLRLGGKRIGTAGNFFEVTVLTDTPTDALIMNEEPFGPIALINPFDTLEHAIAEANRVPYGLSAYAFTSSSRTARAVVEQVQSAMVSINHFGLGIPETPFGGMRDSGYGFEGGSEAIEAYLQTRFVTLANL